MQVPRPFVEPTPRRVRVRLGGVVVADSTRAMLLGEYRGEDALPTYFIPLADVRPGVLVDRAADGTWSVQAGGERAERAAWPPAHDTGL